MLGGSGRQPWPCDACTRVHTRCPCKTGAGWGAPGMWGVSFRCTEGGSALEASSPGTPQPAPHISAASGPLTLRPLRRGEGGPRGERPVEPPVQSAEPRAPPGLGAGPALRPLAVGPEQVPFPLRACVSSRKTEITRSHGTLVGFKPPTWTSGPVSTGLPSPRTPTPSAFVEAGLRSPCAPKQGEAPPNRDAPAG